MSDLRTQLEILRGEPITIFDGDPLEIPCIETSDAEQLCKQPVVSVHMITYNHEPYIRQAIEGVMMQQTDFEFELIIGEDASQDKTREICFEYQKQYPDKIRVLWSEQNVYHLGGNGRRVRAHSRGEFIAFCEGDDYWTDPLKLQKQVDVMRKHPNVGLCFCGATIYREATHTWKTWNDGLTGFQPGLISSSHYVLWTLFGKNPKQPPGPEFFVMTATLLVRKNVYVRATQEDEIFNWRLSVGDSILCLGVGVRSEVYYLADEVAVYRQMLTGVTMSTHGQTWLDTLLVRVYFLYQHLGLSFSDTPTLFRKNLARAALDRHERCPVEVRRKLARALLRDSVCMGLYLNVANFPLLVTYLPGAPFGFLARWCRRYSHRVVRFYFIPRKLRKRYATCVNAAPGKEGLSCRQ